MTINDDFTCDLKLRYKGERTWLHGTDLFDEILNKMVIRSIKFFYLVSRALSDGMDCPHPLKSDTA